MLRIEKNVPLPKRATIEIVNTILSMEDGDSVFISYEYFTKTDVINSIANARLRIQAKGLKLKTARDAKGTRVWAYKSNNL